MWCLVLKKSCNFVLSNYIINIISSINCFMNSLLMILGNVWEFCFKGFPWCYGKSVNGMNNTCHAILYFWKRFVLCACHIPLQRNISKKWQTIMSKEKIVINIPIVPTVIFKSVVKISSFNTSLTPKKLYSSAVLKSFDYSEIGILEMQYFRELHQRNVRAYYGNNVSHAYKLPMLSVYK